MKKPTVCGSEAPLGKIILSREEKEPKLTNPPERFSTFHRCGTHQGVERTPRGSPGLNLLQAALTFHVPNGQSNRKPTSQLHAQQGSFSR
jgi:hypothetical protein